MFRWIFAVLIAGTSGTIAGETLTARIDAILNGSVPARRAFWGIHIVDLNRGSFAYHRNEDHFFAPASNMKLFTTAMGLMRLGPDYRFHTQVVMDGTLDTAGKVHGDVRLVGGGDPNLSARIVPYKKDEWLEDPLHDIAELANQIAAAGVKRIDGDIIGDDTAFVWEPYPAGWSVDDPIWEYGAPVSALTLNDNAFTLTIRPGGEAGDPARLSLFPALEYLTIENRIRTSAQGEQKIHYERLPGSPELILSGQILIKGQAIKEKLAIDDPALFAAHALRDALLKRGVEVTGEPRSRHRMRDEAFVEGPTRVLAKHDSQPLVDALRIVDKESQNLHAEIVLREVARVRRQEGTRTAGLEELQAFLQEAGIEEVTGKDAPFHFEDGSGLSRLDMVTPRTITKLLSYMYGSKQKDAWIEMLPIGGEDGTLSHRFAAVAVERSVRAKTGSLSHVSSLSGYALAPNGNRYAFSILVNNFNAPAAEIRAVIDKIVLSLMNRN